MEPQEFIEGIFTEIHETPHFHVEGSQLREKLKSGRLPAGELENLAGRIVRRVETAQHHRRELGERIPEHPPAVEHKPEDTKAAEHTPAA